MLVSTISNQETPKIKELKKERRNDWVTGLGTLFASASLLTFSLSEIPHDLSATVVCAIAGVLTEGISFWKIVSATQRTQAIRRAKKTGF